MVNTGAVGALGAGLGAIQFGVDVSKLQPAWDTIGRGISGLVSQVDTDMTKMATSMKTSGVLMVVAFAGAVYGLGKMYQEFSKFQYGMVEASTMLNDSNKVWMTTYSEGVKNMSVQFGQTKASLSESLYEILSATIAPADAMRVLEATSLLAAGGFTTVATATDVTLTVLNAYKLGVDKVTEVTDQLMAAVIPGRFHFQDLASSLGQVVSMAAMANISLPELLATLTTLTRAGININDAVTYTNRVIQSFIRPSKDAKQAAKDLGVDLSATALLANGLRKSMLLLTNASLESTSNIFDEIRALKGAIPLLRDITGYTADYNFILENNGLVAKNAAAAMATNEIKMKKLKEAFSNLAIVIGQDVSPIITDLIDKLGLFIKELAKTESPLRVLIGAASRSTLEFGLLTAGLVIFSKTMNMLGTYLKGFAAAGLLTKALGVTGLIVLLYEASMAVYRFFDGLQKAHSQAQRQYREIAEAAVLPFQQRAEVATQMLKDLEFIKTYDKQIVKSAEDSKKAGDIWRKIADNVFPNAKDIDSAIKYAKEHKDVVVAFAEAENIELELLDAKRQEERLKKVDRDLGEELEVLSKGLFGQKRMDVVLKHDPVYQNLKERLIKYGALAGKNNAWVMDILSRQAALQKKLDELNKEYTKGVTPSTTEKEDTIKYYEWLFKVTKDYIMYRKALVLEIKKAALGSEKAALAEKLVENVIDQVTAKYKELYKEGKITREEMAKGAKEEIIALLNQYKTQMALIPSIGAKVDLAIKNISNATADDLTKNLDKIQTRWEKFLVDMRRDGEITSEVQAQLYEKAAAEIGSFFTDTIHGFEKEGFKVMDRLMEMVSNVIDDIVTKWLNNQITEFLMGSGWFKGFFGAMGGAISTGGGAASGGFGGVNTTGGFAGAPAGALGGEIRSSVVGDKVFARLSPAEIVIPPELNRSFKALGDMGGSVGYGGDVYIINAVDTQSFASALSRNKSVIQQLSAEGILGNTNYRKVLRRYA